MVEQQDTTPENSRAHELTAAELDAVSGGFCGFYLPVTPSQKAPPVSEIVITKKVDCTAPLIFF